MKKKIRIDPLTSSGVVDVDYFASEDYKYDTVVVLRYLKDEGFDEVEGEFKLNLLDRVWWISVK
jgi:hypothetical protein